MSIAFKKAERAGTKLRMAIMGVSGSGKTFTALSIGTNLRPGKVALIDTEHGSAAKYGDLYAFDSVSMNAPFSVDKYIAAIQVAIDAKYELLIIDSLSHAWSGEGGLLDQVEDYKRRNKISNGLQAWGQYGSPLQAKLIQAIVSAPMDIIATLRSKQAYEIDKNDEGKTSVKKLGLQAIQREGTEYEFDIVADMDSENVLCVTKSRCMVLTGKVIRKPNGKELATTLTEWLS